MRAHPLYHFSYFRQHVLAAGGSLFTINALWCLDHRIREPARTEKLRRLPPNLPEPGMRIKFELPLHLFGLDWHAAILRARALTDVHVDGVPARIQLTDVELNFRDYRSDHDFGPKSEATGYVHFTATLEHAFPFPRSLDDPSLVSALEAAHKLLRTYPPEFAIQADEILQLERYWVFKIRNIGMNGVVVDRTNLHAFTISGANQLHTWLFAYEHQLLDEPAGDLVIDRVLDGERAHAAFKGTPGFYVGWHENLPFTRKHGANWILARNLEQAGDAVEWRIVPAATRPA